MNVYKTKCRRVIDGDTFAGDLLLEPFDLVLTDQRFRLIGVDTPERGDYLYKEATDRAKELLGRKTVKVTVYDKDVFGRWLVDVSIPGIDDTLNDILLNEGLAEVYSK